jgi:membrane protein
VKPWTLTRDTIAEFFNDGALSDGAAIAFYTITSIGPVLFIVVAIAGLVFGEDAARGAVSQELGDLMGKQSADLLQTTIANAKNPSSGVVATFVGLLTLMLTASGVFTQMQATLNKIWKAQPSGTMVSQLIKARAVSLGLVAALGFLLLTSLVISTLLTAVGTYLDQVLPFGQIILQAINFGLSLLLMTVMFAAIYKVLPDTQIAWRDVIVGGLATALLFDVGKFLISLYIGSSAIASSYGAAGSLIVVLLWVYYSAQIFLIGAEFTKVFAMQQGSRARS